MTQTLIPTKEDHLTAILIPQTEGWFRHVAEMFDDSFWPPEPLEQDLVEFLTTLIERGREMGIETRGLVEICGRFRFTLTL
jgi:hypothetical protein